MMELCVGVIDAKRMLIRRDIVAEDQIQFEVVAALSGDRRDRVVRRIICERIDEGILIRISAPCREDMVRKRDQAVRIGSRQTDAGHRPFDDAALYVLEALDRKCALHRRLGHREFIVAALEVVVAQDRAADDRKIRVGSQEVMREGLDEIKQLAERVVVDRHRNVLRIEHDAVLIVIDIR